MANRPLAHQPLTLMYDGLSALEYMKESEEHFTEVLDHALADVNTRYANR